MEFKTGLGNDIAIELDKYENLALRQALNACKKDDKAIIQLNLGEWFSPHILVEEEEKHD